MMNYIHKILLNFYRFFSRRYNRFRLQNKDFSIITNTCIGGVIYHELGLQFLSPTINCWMEDKDFYRFAKNVETYVKKPLQFVQGIDPTPTAYCGDVLIHFNHYHSEIEANTKWIERCKRINWDNIFFIGSDEPSKLEHIPVTVDDIKSLYKVKGCKGVLIFSSHNDWDGIKDILLYKRDKRGDFAATYMNDHTKIGTWCWEHMFDYVHWLNTGEIKHC